MKFFIPFIVLLPFKLVPGHLLQAKNVFSALVKVLQRQSLTSLFVFSLSVYSEIQSYLYLWVQYSTISLVLSATSTVLFVCLLITQPELVNYYNHPDEHAMRVRCEQCRNQNALFTFHSKMADNCVANFYADSSLLLNAIGQGNFFKFFAYNIAIVCKFLYQFNFIRFGSSDFVEKMLKEPGLFWYKILVAVLVINGVKHISIQMLSYLQSRATVMSIQLMPVIENNNIILLKYNDKMVQGNAKMLEAVGDQDTVKMKNEFGFEEDVEVLRGNKKIQFFKNLKEKWTESFALRE